MKKGMKSILTLLLATSLIAMSVTPVMAANRKTIDYVAFGDSVAAGVRGGNAAPGDPSYESKSQYGYTNIIANDLSHSDILSNFSKDKNLCRSGMTAAELAENCNKLLIENTDTHEYNIVKNAEIVTLDIGANDLLGPLYDYVAKLDNINDATPDDVALILSEIQKHMLTEGRAIQTNIVKILQDILTVNPKVKIYVMGYYNPLPALPEIYGLNGYVSDLNFIIDDIVTAFKNSGASITYVDTMEAMAMTPTNYTNYNLLVSTDIHPTEEGYQAIADEFMKVIK
jgi:lysophospholipase L1-like esterase